MLLHYTKCKTYYWLTLHASFTIKVTYFGEFIGQSLTYCFSGDMFREIVQPVHQFTKQTRRFVKITVSFFIVKDAEMYSVRNTFLCELQ